MPEKSKKKLSLQQVAVIAMLTALYVVLNRFASVSAWNINIGFSFVATVTAACMYGIPGGILVGGLGDLIGAILFPKGAYFPGFTLCAVLVGLIYALFLRKSKSFISIALAAVTSQTISSLLLNTLWISILFGADFKATFLSRLPQYFLMIAVQLVVSPILLKVSDRIKKGLK